MPRQGYKGVMIPTKIRKRGCSSSSSTSSRVHNYRLNKRAILVRKSRAGLVIGSRSSTPVPTWRTTPLTLRGAAIDSPKYSQSGKSTQPVSARRLAATLWEMNAIPSPSPSRNLELMKKKSGGFNREKMQSKWGSLPPQLLDPSHCLSEKMDQSGESSYRRRTTSISQKLQSATQHGLFDSISNATVMEIETRSRPLSSNCSVSGGRNRLKDVSNALTTSKELLKIINHIWAHADQPSSSMSLISALHAELERARLQVNQLIQEQRSEKNEINYLVKCFAEEKASWKNKERQAIEAAMGSMSAELEVERKLRRRAESLNNKLGIELAEMKSSFLKAVKDMKSEKRDSCKLPEAKDKNSAIGRKQLEVLGKMKRDKEEDRARYLLGRPSISHQEDEGEVEDASDDSSVESDLHSIELKVDNNKSKIHKWAYTGALNDEIKARNSMSGVASRRSTSLQRSVPNEIDETQRYKSVKDHVFSNSRFSYHSPSRQTDVLLPSREHTGEMTSSKSRMPNGRGSKW